MLTKSLSSSSRRAILGQFSDMDLRLLKVFKCVADSGGMSAAEMELNIGASTISRHMKDLETRLGLCLCRRGRGGFALTAEGQQVYVEAVRLLGAVQAFRNGLGDIHQRMGGHLEVALFDKTASNPAAKIHLAIARFTELAPDVSISITVASSTAIVQGLLDGRFALGVIPMHRDLPTLSYTPLFAEQMRLYCGINHPLFQSKQESKKEPASYADLSQYHFAGLSYNSQNLEFSHQAKWSRKATASDQEAIATLILSGKYLGFLPDHYAESFQRQGLLQALPKTPFSYVCTFAVSQRRSPVTSRAALILQRCLIETHT